MEQRRAQPGERHGGIDKMLNGAEALSRAPPQERHLAHRGRMTGGGPGRSVKAVTDAAPNLVERAIGRLVEHERARIEIRRVIEERLAGAIADLAVFRSGPFRVRQVALLPVLRDL